MCCPAHKWRKRHEYTARLNSLDHLGWAPRMDSSNVLLALDEQKKWRERRKRIRDRLRQLERRRTTLRKELEGGRKKILEYNQGLTDLRDGNPTPAVLPPHPPG